MNRETSKCAVLAIPAAMAAGMEGGCVRLNARIRELESEIGQICACFLESLRSIIFFA